MAQQYKFRALAFIQYLYKRIEYYRKLTHFSISRILFHFSLSLSVTPYRFVLSLLLFCVKSTGSRRANTAEYSLLTFVLFQHNLWGGEWRENENQFIHYLFSEEMPTRLLYCHAKISCSWVSAYIRPVAIIITLKIKIIISFQQQSIFVCKYSMWMARQQQQQHRATNATRTIKSALSWIWAPLLLFVCSLKWSSKMHVLQGTFVLSSSLLSPFLCPHKPIHHLVGINWFAMFAVCVCMYCVRPLVPHAIYRPSPSNQHMFVCRYAFVAPVNDFNRSKRETERDREREREKEIEKYVRRRDDTNEQIFCDKRKFISTILL